MLMATLASELEDPSSMPGRMCACGSNTDAPRVLGMAFLERINPFIKGERRVTLSALTVDGAESGPEAEGFMDEPREVTGGFEDDSLASEVGDRVKEIVDGAERAAIAAYEESEEEAERVLERARAEARSIREDALRQADRLAEDRVRRIHDLGRAIESRSGELAALSDDPDSAMEGIELLLDALARRADDLAGRTGAKPRLPEPELPTEPEPEPEPEGEPDAYEAEPELAGVAAGDIPEPLRDVRLGALRMAVAGVSRNQLESELRETLDAQDAAAILDDVFGRPRSPFPKWAAAAKRAR
jgi:hypothetical protein